MSLMDRMLKSGAIKHASVLSESSFFNAKDTIPTDLPILNLAFSGDIGGGLVPGLTIFAGQSKSYKTLLGLYAMKAYFNKYSDAVALLYDSEFGITPEYLEMNNIDSSKVIHIPIEHIEQLKFDIVKRLEQIERADHVFIMIDSLGALSSKKEVEDAIDEKSVTDMTRAKSIRSLLRIITPHLTMKDIPCIVVNHIYQTMEMYSKAVVSGGTAVTYSANQIFIISRSQEKGSDGEIDGWNFTINIEKSRFVKEKSKLIFQVLYDGGINKWSGLMDLAKEFGYIIQSGAWYQLMNFDTNNIDEKKVRSSDIGDSFYNRLCNDERFKELVKNKFMLGAIKYEKHEEEEK